jgi:Tol biopolymer transport system component
LSADASSVAFESPWMNLDGRNLESDVFVLDLTNTASQLISVHDPGLSSAALNGPSTLWPTSVSTNGRFTAFSTWANNLLPNATNDWINVFEHDLITGANILVSVGTNGLEGNNLSTEPSVSADGRYVAFTSFATNLVAGDANLYSDVFVRDLEAGVTTLVSVGTNGGTGNNSSYLPQISSDGRYVLFCSAAVNLAPDVAGGNNLYLRDLQLGETYALTTNGFGSQGSFQSYSMTPGGTDIAFVGVGSGNVSNLYAWNSSLAALIYTNNSSGLANVSLSPDGQWLAYVANDVLSVQGLGITATNFEIARGSFGPRAGLKFSSDDRFLTYAMNTNIYLYDFLLGTSNLVSTAFDSTNQPNGAADSPVISADGSFIAYRSFSSNAVPQNPNGVPAVLLFERLSNTTVLASANLCGVSPAMPSLNPAFTSDGQMLLFQSWARDLVAQDFNQGGGAFALDLFGLPGALNSTNSAPPLDAGMLLESEFSSGQTPVVAWPFAPGQSYLVQYKDDLTDPVWQNLDGVISFIGSQGYFADPAPPSSQRFYRIGENK